MCCIENINTTEKKIVLVSDIYKRATYNGAMYFSQMIYLRYACYFFVARQLDMHL